MVTDLAGMVPAPQTPASLPYPDADLFDVVSLLSEDEQKALRRIRKHVQDVVRPASIEPWNNEEFPFDLLHGLAAVGLGALELEKGSWLFRGLVYAEVARADVSISALVGIHNELIVGMLQQLGSDEQRETWLPRLRDFKAIGAFALTEPEHGSDIAGGLQTSAKREGDEWILSGTKRWIGAGTIADFALVWARDQADNQVKAFLVEAERPGYHAEKIRNKMGLRIMQNAHIHLDDVRIPATNLLPGAHSFSQANEMLRNSRVWVGWQAVGAQLAAFDVAREYTINRQQFGMPLASFQLVQQPLSEMIGNANACLGLMMQVARMQQKDQLNMVHAAMGKSTSSRLLRATAAHARDLLGGNGVVSDFEAAKIFADAEIIYTYEGTYTINSLIVGRGVTGLSAFR